MSKKSVEFRRGIDGRERIESACEFFNGVVGKEICKKVSHRESVVAIRNNYFNIYINGCSILRFDLSTSNPKFEIHRKYLPKAVQASLPSKWKQKVYIPMAQERDGDLSIQEASFSFLNEILKTPNENLSEYLTGVKAGPEKTLIHNYIKLDKPCLIDLEIAYKSYRVDIATPEDGDNGVLLSLTEAKPYFVNCIRSATGALYDDGKVLKQMSGYQKFMRRDASQGGQGENIIDSYLRIAKNYTEDFGDLGLIPEENINLMKRFIKNPKFNEMPQLIILGTKEGLSLRESMQGKITAPNKGDHYETLKRGCEDNGWKLLPLSKS